MTWSVDTSAQNTYGTTNPHTQALTLASTAKLLVVALFVNGSTARTGGAPTYNGTPMTDSGQGFVVHTECGVELWYLIDPDTGSSYNISVPNTGAESMQISAISFIPSGGDGAYDNSNSATGTTANPSLSLTVDATGNLIVGALGSGFRNVPTAGTNFTLLHTYDAGNQTWGSEYDLAGSATPVTVDFGQDADDWGLIGISFREIALTPASDNQAAYIKGSLDVTDNLEAYIKGSLDTSSNRSAYISGGLEVADNREAYIKGKDTASSQLAGYVAGGLQVASEQAAYISGGLEVADNTSAYMAGSESASDNKSAYISGTAANTIDIQGNEGHIRYVRQSGDAVRAILNAVSTQDVESTLKFRFSHNLPGTSFGLFIRASRDWDSLELPTSGYEVRFESDGAYQINRISAGSRNLLGNDTWAGDQSAYQIRFQAIGTEVKFRIWQDGSGEPGVWDNEYSTSSEAAGTLQLSAGYIAGGNDGVWDIYLDDMSYHSPAGEEKSSAPAYIAGVDTSTSRLSAYIAGANSDTDNKAAYIQGAQHDTDNRAAYISGTATATDNRSAYISGVAGGTSDNKAAYIHGQVAALDNRSAYIAGTDTATDNKSAYVAGGVNVDSSALAYISGSEAATDNKSAYIAGGVNVLDNREAYIHGQQAAVSSAAAYIAGGVPSNNALQAYIKGQDTSADNKAAYIAGGESATDNAAAYIAGTDTASDNKSAYIAGSIDETSSVSAYIAGVAGASSQQQAFIAGTASDASRLAAYIHGKETSDDSKSAYVVGGINVKSRVPAYIAGTDTASDSKAAYIEGVAGDVLDNKSAYIAGTDTASDNKSAYIAGTDTASDNKAAYIAGTDTASDNRSAYIAGQVSQVSSVEAYIAGVDTASDNKSAYISGLTYFPFTEDWTGSNEDEWRRSHWVTGAS